MIKIVSTEYTDGASAIREYTLKIFNICIYKAKFTSTNNEAVKKLTIIRPITSHICGFTKK